jgi:glutamine synthetase
MEKLSEHHHEHILLYGSDNHFRLTGKHETSSIDKFSYGMGNRGCSVRIPVCSIEKGSGYLEDRRPASNVDPYMTTAVMVDTICLNSKYLRDLLCK